MKIKKYGRKTVKIEAPKATGASKEVAPPKFWGVKLGWGQRAPTVWVDGEYLIHTPCGWEHFPAE